MGFLYEQTETDSEIVIRYTRYLPGFALLIVAYMLVIFLFPSPWATAAIGFVSMFVIFRDVSAVRSMVREANKDGRVSRSGHAWSMANPVTYQIVKQKRPSQRRPKKGTQRSKRNRR